MHTYGFLFSLYLAVQALIILKTNKKCPAPTHYTDYAIVCVSPVPTIDNKKN